MTNKLYSDLSQLGGSTKLPENPDDAVLERVTNPPRRPIV